VSIATLHQQPGSSTGVAGRCEKARCFLGPRWLGVGRPAWRCFEALLSALATIPVSPPPVAHSVPVTLTLARTAVLLAWTGRVPATGQRRPASSVYCQFVL
jgi:hypothetical protein